MPTVLITTEVVSLNPAYGEMYSIQHYMITYVGILRQVCGFLRVLRFFSTNKTDRRDINEILLKLTLTLYHRLVPNLKKALYTFIPHMIRH